jgi:hypothetical protein
MKSAKKFAETTAPEPGIYTLVVDKAYTRKKAYGDNPPVDVFTAITKVKGDATKGAWVDLRLPVFVEDGDNSNFVKNVRSIAYFAEACGIVAPPPPAPAKGDRSPEARAAWDARDAWALEVTNAVLADPDALKGASFIGTFAKNEAGYVNLVKKEKVGG